MAALKTLNTLTRATAKTWNVLASAAWKTWNALDTVVAAAKSYEWLDEATDGTDLTTYSFADINFGTATADRLIVVVTSIGTVTNRTISSATIGGVAATLVSNTSGRNHMISAVVPSGTSGTVEITFNLGAVRCGIEVHALKGLDSATHTATAELGPSANTALTVTITVPANGIAIAGSFTSASTTLTGWTGATERNTVGIEATNTMSGASYETASEQVDHDFTCTWAASGTMQVVAAAWA